MPLRSLLFLVLACTDDPYDFSGGSGGGGDDSGGDADSDADTDSDTDVIPIDFDYDELTDVIAYDSPMTVLATNVTYNSLDVIDLGTRTTTTRIQLGDEPRRVKWDPATGLAYVVYGLNQEQPGTCASDIGCDNRLDIVDLAKETIETVTLTVGKSRYVATDVALGRGGGVFVLGDADDWWSQEAVVEVGADRFLTVWPLEEDSEVNGVPLWYDGTSIYAEHWRFTFGTDPKKKTPLLVEANNYSPDDYSDWNGTPMHTALASDGTGILFPGEYSGANHTVVELDPTKDGAWHEYDLHSDISYGATDMAYTHDQTRVVTVGLDYDDYRLQVFDRATEKELRSTSLGGVGTISAQTEILVVGSDDAYAWVYVFEQGYNDDEGRFLVTPLEL
jgi:hypothetical protein